MQNLSHESKCDLNENDLVGGAHLHMNGLALRVVLT